MTRLRPPAAEVGWRLPAFLLFAAALLVVGPAEASRTTTDARSNLAPSSSLELSPLGPVEPIDPVESSRRFGFAEDLGLLDPEAGPGCFVLFAVEAAQCELTYARNNPINRVDPDGRTDVHFVVAREWGSTNATPGRFHISGTSISGYTLELPDRGNQKDISRIPSGTYSARRAVSRALGDVLALDGTAPRTDVLVHSGNSAEDTQGCLLVGSTRAGTDRVGGSRAKKAEIIRHVDSVIEADRAAGETTRIIITISNPIGDYRYSVPPGAPVPEPETKLNRNPDVSPPVR